MGVLESGRQSVGQATLIRDRVGSIPKLRGRRQRGERLRFPVPHRAPR